MPEWTVRTKPFQLTKDQYKSLARRLSMPGFWTIYLMFLFVAGYELLFKRTFGTVYAFVCMVPISYLLATWWSNSNLTAMLKHSDNAGFFEEVELHFDSMGVRSIQDGSTLAVAWSKVRKHLNHGEDMALFLNSVQFLYVPKSAFESEEDWLMVKRHVESTVPVRK